MVEFALVFPILFTFFVASIEFARANQVKNVAAFSAYQGCRQAIIPGATAAGATSATQQALTASSITGSTITVNPSTIDSNTTTVTVTVSVQMNNVGWITPRFTKNATITRSCTLTRENAN